MYMNFMDAWYFCFKHHIVNSYMFQQVLPNDYVKYFVLSINFKRSWVAFNEAGAITAYEYYVDFVKWNMAMK